MEPLNYEKRGYLNEPFRLFHLADDKHEKIPYHYHSFHKIIILLAGRAGYAIEGERYALQPGDYVLVGRGSIHKPIVEQNDFYERAILYISPEYLQQLSTPDCDLERCFRQAQEEFRYVYHAGADRIRELFSLLEQVQQEGTFGAALLRQALFTQLMVEVNRVCLTSGTVSAADGDSKIIAILQYLNTHLTEPLTLDQLASHFFISKGTLCHTFKKKTSFTVVTYINMHRIRYACILLREGYSVQETCTKSGFTSTEHFIRTFTAFVNTTPGKYAKSLRNGQNVSIPLAVYKTDPDEPE